MTQQNNKPPRPVINVETEKVPEAVAMRLGEAAYRATLAWLTRQQKESPDNSAVSKGLTSDKSAGEDSRDE